MHDENAFHFTRVGDLQNMHCGKPPANGHIPTDDVLRSVDFSILYYWIDLPVPDSDTRVEGSQLRERTCGRLKQVHVG